MLQESDSWISDCFWRSGVCGANCWISTAEKVLSQTHWEGIAGRITRMDWDNYSLWCCITLIARQDTNGDGRKKLLWWTRYKLNQVHGLHASWTCISRKYSLFFAWKHWMGQSQFLYSNQPAPTTMVRWNSSSNLQATPCHFWTNCVT